MLFRSQMVPFFLRSQIETFLCYSSLPPFEYKDSPKSKSPQQKTHRNSHQPAATTSCYCLRHLLEASNTRRTLLAPLLLGGSTRAPQGSPRRRPRRGGRAEIAGERTGAERPVPRAPRGIRGGHQGTEIPMQIREGPRRPAQSAAGAMRSPMSAMMLAMFATMASFYVAGR